MAAGGTLDVLETDRLLLRHQRVDDATVHRKLWTERDPRVPPHRRIDDQGRPTVADVAARIREASDDPRPGLLTVELKDPAAVIGYCGLIWDEDGSPELAYELLRAFHGRGYATEAGRAVVGWADEAGYRRLQAGVWDWNTASRRVLAKLGFREVGEVPPNSIHGHSLMTVREGRTSAERASPPP